MWLLWYGWDPNSCFIPLPVHWWRIIQRRLALSSDLSAPSVQTAICPSVRIYAAEKRRRRDIGRKGGNFRSFRYTDLIFNSIHRPSFPSVTIEYQYPYGKQEWFCCTVLRDASRRHDVDQHIYIHTQIRTWGSHLFCNSACKSLNTHLFSFYRLFYFLLYSLIYFASSIIPSAFLILFNLFASLTYLWERNLNCSVWSLVFPVRSGAFVNELGEGKGKGHPITGHEAPDGEQMYSCPLPSTSASDGVGWTTPRPGRFTPGRLCGSQSRSGRVRKISPPPGFDARTVQPVASRYTDWAMAAPRIRRIQLKNNSETYTEQTLTGSSSKILPEKLTVSQLVKKFPQFYGTRRFITAFTRARHLSLSWARKTQSTSLYFNLFLI